MQDLGLGQNLPAVEWLEYKMNHMKTTANIFIRELDVIWAEYVSKNVHDLYKEEYQSLLTFERILKEFHQITQKAISTLNEHDHQTLVDASKKFPWMQINGNGNIVRSNITATDCTRSHTSEENPSLLQCDVRVNSIGEDKDTQNNGVIGDGSCGSSNARNDLFVPLEEIEIEIPHRNDCDGNIKLSLENSNIIQNDGIPDPLSSHLSSSKSDCSFDSVNEEKVNPPNNRFDLDLDLFVLTREYHQDDCRCLVESCCHYEITQFSSIEMFDHMISDHSNEAENQAEMSQGIEVEASQESAEPSQKFAEQSTESAVRSQELAEPLQESAEPAQDRNQILDSSSLNGTTTESVLDDYKLKSNCSYVALEYIPVPVLDWMFANDSINISIIDDNNIEQNQSGISESVDDPLLKALKKLMAFDPCKIRKRINNTGSVQNSKRVIKSLKSELHMDAAADNNNVLKEGKVGTRRIDGLDSDDDGNDCECCIDEIVRTTDSSVRRSLLSPEMAWTGKLFEHNDAHNVGSDDEIYWDVTAVSPNRLSERDAKNEVLKNTKNWQTESSGSDISVLIKTDDNEKQNRKRRRNYYLPNVFKIPKQMDSEDSDSQSDSSKSQSADEFNWPKFKSDFYKNRWSRVILSDSEDSVELNEYHSVENNEKSSRSSVSNKSPKRARFSILDSYSSTSDSERARFSILDSYSSTSDSERARFSILDSDASTSDSDSGACGNNCLLSEQTNKQKSLKEFFENLNLPTATFTKTAKMDSIAADLSVSGPDESVKETMPAKTTTFTITETEVDRPRRGRRNIRRIMDDAELSKQSRQAEKSETARRQRVSSRIPHVFINESVDESNHNDLILDVDLDSMTPIVTVDSLITRKLKPHQEEGIKFMWNACFESVERFKNSETENEGGGCILAHCMGLGKTLQSVALIHTVMTSKLLQIKTVLILCPLNTVGNWEYEFQKWLQEDTKAIKRYMLCNEKNDTDRLKSLRKWHKTGGVAILNYDSFRLFLTESKRKVRSDDIQQAFNECLLDPGPSMVICDEGHVFKNDKSKISIVANKIRTKRRIILTGTPLQNNLLEYHTMVEFVKPKLLGSKQEFSNRFVNPITNGQHKDSTELDVDTMKKRAHVLHKILDGCVLRKDFSVLIPFLPPKYEYAVLIKMTEIQKTLYAHYLASIKDGKSLQELVKNGSMLFHLANLAKVWSHPWTLEMKHGRKRQMTAYNFRSFEETELNEEDCSVSDSGNECENTGSDYKANAKKFKGKRKEDASTSTSLQELSGAIIRQGGDWWSQFFSSKEQLKLLEHSSKIMILMEIIKSCKSCGDKVLVFSQFVYSLDIIEEYLKLLDNQNQNQSRWRKNIEYFRIDGSVKTGTRQKHCDIFNDADVPSAQLFLISTKAGGLGINLVGANRVVIFDASWNPSQDVQSVFRVFRLGQTKPCYIYRLLAHGTMEEKIYNRQIVKLSLSGRVVDEHQIKRHFAFEDIAEMYKFDPNGNEIEADIKNPPLRDDVLENLLVSHKEWIHSYQEHDSLLQNQTGEKLTEAEQKNAWLEYKNENENRNKKIITKQAKQETQAEAEQKDAWLEYENEIENRNN